MYRFHLYWDTRHLPPGGFFDVRGIKILVAVSVFGEEIYQAPKTWAEKAYAKLINYNSFSKGIHFAAWDQRICLLSKCVRFQIVAIVKGRSACGSAILVSPARHLHRCSRSLTRVLLGGFRAENLTTDR